MTVTNKPVPPGLQQALDAYFAVHPDAELRAIASQTLSVLLMRDSDLPGAPGAWAGGIVYAVGSGGCGVPGVLNSDLEKAFGASMGTIRRRARQVKEVLGLDAPVPIEGLTPPAEFTLRDEANAICAYAFRNGPLERIHAEYRISQPDMKELMVNASEHLAKIMAMKQRSPEQYDRFIRRYHHQFCRNWER